MPYDGYSVGVILISAALLAAAARRSLPTGFRVVLILLAALLIRADAASQFSLHAWDERYHALVAKNLIAHPFVPTLYREAPLAYDYTDWMTSHVWLHKPPGALWPMAGSMAIFGVNELAMRLPGVVLSTLAVWLTFLIGVELFSARVGLLAAAFHAVNGFLVALASGRRVADHVDTSLVFWIEVGVWMSLLHARRNDRRSLIGAGVAFAAGLMTKSLPASLIVVVAYAIFAGRWPAAKALVRSAAVFTIGVVVAAPWLLYTQLTFPREAAWSWRYTLMHLVRPLEHQDAGALSYIIDMPAYFGEFVWIPMIASAFIAVRGPRARPLLAWVLVPYLVFSAAPTRISAFVMVAAPAIFLLEANFWCWLRDRRDSFTSGPLRVAGAVVLFGVLVLPARYLLDPANVFERRDRSPASARQLRRIDPVLGLERGVIFNMPTPIEAMFYSRLIAYPQLPTGAQVAGLKASRMPIVIYLPEGSSLWIPPEWNAITLKAAQLR
jgi:4-amino-4-deoxy-L-arabinose transferase-like glycosyltransferase